MLELPPRCLGTFITEPGFFGLAARLLIMLWAPLIGCELIVVGVEMPWEWLLGAGLPI